MKIDSMRWLDDYAGSVMCFVLTLIVQAYRFMTPGRFKKNDHIEDGNIKNILIIKFFGMGSIILASPAIKAIKKKYPDAKIYFMTFSSNREICDMLQISDVNLFIRKTNLIEFARDISSALVRLNREGIDLAFDLEFFSRITVILLLLSGARFRIGYFLRKVWRGNLLTHEIYFNNYKHITRAFSAVLSPLGIDEESTGLPRIDISDDEPFPLTNVMSADNTLLPLDKKMVCMNVNASELSLDRKWPGENFARLAEKFLNQSDDIAILFIGSSSEKRYVDDVISLIENHRNRVTNISGKINLRELVVVLKHSEMLITCDSGPMHVAASVDVPTVALFGPETPVRYRPLGCKDILFWKDLYCSPCLNVYNAKKSMCGGNNRCMSMISVDEVFDNICETFPEILETEKAAYKDT